MSKVLKMKPSMTICTKCKHYKFIHTNKRESKNMWFNHFCKAVPHKKVIDPVTGEMSYLIDNDLEQAIYSTEKEDQYPFCRDINDGNCEYYEEK